jgi:hypothetical protein
VIVSKSVLQYRGLACVVIRFSETLIIRDVFSLLRVEIEVISAFSHICGSWNCIHLIFRGRLLTMRVLSLHIKILNSFFSALRLLIRQPVVLYLLNLYSLGLWMLTVGIVFPSRVLILTAYRLWRMLIAELFVFKSLVNHQLISEGCYWVHLIGGTLRKMALTTCFFIARTNDIWITVHVLLLSQVKVNLL